MISRSTDGSCETSLYRKFDETRSLIHASSAHHPKIKRLLIRNEAIRLKKICSTSSNFEKCLQHLHEELSKRGYRRKQIQRQFRDVRRMKRDELLSKKTKRNENDLFTVLDYHPALMGIQTDVNRAISSLELNRDIEIRRPRIGYRTAYNLQRILNSAKTEKGTSGKCNDKRCKCCANMNVSNSLNSSITGMQYSIKGTHTCKSSNLIYLCECMECQQQYIGETSGQMNIRMNNRRSDIKSKHIGRDGAANHMIENSNHSMSVTILRSGFSCDAKRKNAEQRWLAQLMCDKTLNTFHRCRLP